MKKIFAAIMLLTLLSCEKDFLDINEDPNNPTDVPLNFLLPSAQLDLAGSVGTSGGGLSDITSTYMHQWVQRDNSNDYGIQGSDFGVTAPWLVMYTRALADAELIIKKAEEEDAYPYLGMAQLMKAYGYSVMVDIWGDVPYTEAHRAPEILLPKYDKGSDIYPLLFALIDDAIANLTKESIFTVGKEDLFYGGDKARWIRFANTLKLKLYNQVRLVQNVSAEVQALITEGNLMAGLADDFEMEYGTSVAPENRNPGYVQEWNTGTSNYYISPYFYEVMANLNTFNHYDYGSKIDIEDPRLPYYFYNQIGTVSESTPPENPCSYCYGYVNKSTNEFVTVVPALQGTGMVSIYPFSLNIDPNEGFDQGASKTVPGLYPLGGDFDPGSGGASNFNKGKPQVPQRILTYYARKYIEAELYQTNTVAGDARAAFEEAMWASFRKVNEIAKNVGAPEMDDEAIEIYVDAVLTAYDGGSDEEKLEHIMTQKWIASHGYGIDMYTDYRRTGYPVLYEANTDNLSYTIRTREFPYSFPWPTNNLSVNGNAPKQKNVIAPEAKPFWMK